MIDLSDVTFMIPIKIDSKDREENLKLQLEYLYLNFDCNVYLYECDDTPKVKSIISDDLFNKLYKYRFSEKRKDGLFHRTRMFNEIAKDTESKYIVIHDVDVIASTQSYINATKALRSDKTDFCWLFERRCKYTSKEDKKNFAKEMNVSCFEGCIPDKDIETYGGSIFCNKESFFKAGMENEHIISWGPDDCERFWRWKILGYKMKCIEGILFHLYHTRNENSCVPPEEIKEADYDVHSNYFKNRNEFKKISSIFNKNDMKKYILSWNWINS